MHYSVHGSLSGKTRACRQEPQEEEYSREKEQIGCDINQVKLIKPIVQYSRYTKAKAGAQYVKRERQFFFYPCRHF